MYVCKLILFKDSGAVRDKVFNKLPHLFEQNINIDNKFPNIGFIDVIINIKCRVAIVKPLISLFSKLYNQSKIGEK